MVINNTLRNQCNLLPGSLIAGKWHKKSYRIIKELGSGANGIVYLAESTNGPVALKLSDNGVSIISEMNILKSLSKVQGSSTLGPSFLEADDWVNNGKQLSFYVMEYIKGEELLTFIKKKGQSWIGVLMLQLLASLSMLHKEGWVFGDLKPENLIVTEPAYKIRCVDVGGTTLIGRSIKEFTEFFDRGYWGLGSRKADPAYDLFAVAMIIINSFYPSRFSKKGDGYTQLIELIKQKKGLLIYKNVLEKALLGKYTSAEEMRNDLLAILSRSPGQKKPLQKPRPHLSNNSPNRSVGTRINKKNRINKKGRVFETLLLAIFVSLLYVLYIYTQLL
jgi:serine/threonine protein kinase